MKKDAFKICVCGAGTMGSGIAQTFAQYGYATILFDANASVLETAKQKIAQRMDSSLIHYTAEINDCVADFLIEAIIENAAIKAGLFNSLAKLNTEKTIFASNTSSLSITALAEKFSRPSQLAGMHFFNPAPLMALVEVVSTPSSSPETIQCIMDLAKSIGKTPVLCRDSPGFIVNRVARPYYLEALYLAEKGISDFAKTDRLMEATGFKMGPFKLMDLIGNDINYSVTCIVHEALGKPGRLEPSPIQYKKVEEGMLGRKTGKGYYEYPAK